jgi:hypothetical protein
MVKTHPATKGPAVISRRGFRIKKKMINPLYHLGA